MDAGARTRGLGSAVSGVNVGRYTPGGPGSGWAVPVTQSAESDREQLCEQCGERYPLDVRACPRDGGTLAVVASAEARLGEVIGGAFTLTAVLGRGGMGIVYRARQHSMDRDVAVKLLHPGYAGDPNAVKRVLREAKAASRLSHPNIVTVFDFGQTEGGDLYLVMELLDGQEMLVELEARGALGVNRTVELFAQVCDAVHHAHEQGLVHRDLKPENVFLLSGVGHRQEFIKVLDFGVAHMRTAEQGERLTATGTICGTPAYMSPEQCLSEPVDRRADIYSLGVMLFEALTGRLPFEAESMARMMMAHISEPPPHLSDRSPGGRFPPRLDDLIRRCLAKNPDHRPADAVELSRELAAAQHDPPGEGAGESAGYVARGPAPPWGESSPAIALGSPTPQRPTIPASASALDVARKRGPVAEAPDATGPARPRRTARRWLVLLAAAGVAAVVVALATLPSSRQARDERPPPAAPVRPPHVRRAAEPEARATGRTVAAAPRPASRPRRPPAAGAPATARSLAVAPPGRRTGELEDAAPRGPLASLAKPPRKRGHSGARNGRTSHGRKRTGAGMIE